MAVCNWRFHPTQTECFDWAQHERKISNDFYRPSVRPEVLEG